LGFLSVAPRAVLIDHGSASLLRLARPLSSGE